MLAVLPEHQPYFGIAPPRSVDLFTHDEYHEYDNYAYNQPSHGYAGENPADRDNGDNGDNNDDGGSVRNDNGNHPVHSVKYNSNDDMEYRAEEDTAEEDSHGGDSSDDERKSNADDPTSAHSIDNLPTSHGRIIEDALSTSIGI